MLEMESSEDTPALHVDRPEQNQQQAGSNYQTVFANFVNETIQCGQMRSETDPGEVVVIRKGNKRSKQTDNATKNADNNGKAGHTEANASEGPFPPSNSHQGFYCGQCNFVASSKNSFKKHQRSVHGTDFKCSLCGFQTGWRSFWLNHMKTKHNGHSSNRLESAEDKDDQVKILPNKAGKKACQKKTLKKTFTKETEKDEPKKTNTLFSPTENSHQGFNCGQCILVASSQKSLRNHLRAIHGTDFKCNLCGFQTGWKSLWLNHKKIKHNGHSSSRLESAKDQVDQVKILPKKAKKKLNWEKTIKKTFSKETLYRKDKPKDTNPLSSPTENSHLGFNCSQCTFEASSQKSLRNHQRAIHGTDFKCSLCGFQTGWRSLWRNHMKTKHHGGSGDRLDSVKDKDDDQIKILPSKAGKNLCQEQTIKNIFTEEMMYNEDGLKDVTTLHNEKRVEAAPSHVCHECGRVATNAAALKKHKRVSHGIDFSCSFCLFKTGWKSKFMAHIKKHKKSTTVSPARKQAAKVISSVDTSEKIKKKSPKKAASVSASSKKGQQYRCDKCSYKSKSKKDFLSHTKAVHGTNFSCPFCAFKTGWRSRIEFHLRKHNKGGKASSGRGKIVGKRDAAAKVSKIVAKKKDLLSKSNKPDLTSKEFKNSSADSGKKLPLRRNLRAKKSPQSVPRLSYSSPAQDKVAAKKKFALVRKFSCNHCSFSTLYLKNLHRHVLNSHNKKRNGSLKKFPQVSSQEEARFNSNRPTTQKKTPIQFIDLTDSDDEQNLPHNTGRDVLSSDNSSDSSSDSGSDSTDNSSDQGEVRRYLSCTLCDFKTHIKNILVCHTKVKHKTSLASLQQPAAAAGANEPGARVAAALHQCPVCNYSSRFKKYLTRHIKGRHSDDYPCNVAGCRYKTGYLSLLEKHQQTHLRRQETSLRAEGFKSTITKLMKPCAVRMKPTDHLQCSSYLSKRELPEDEAAAAAVEDTEVDMEPRASPKKLKQGDDAVAIVARSSSEWPFFESAEQHGSAPIHDDEMEFEEHLKREAPSEPHGAEEHLVDTQGGELAEGGFQPTGSTVDGEALFACNSCEFYSNNKSSFIEHLHKQH